MASAGILHLHLDVSTSTKKAEVNVKAVAQVLDKNGFMDSGGATDSATAVIDGRTIEKNKQSELYRSLGSLIAKLDVLAEVINEFSKVSVQFSFP